MRGTISKRAQREQEERRERYLAEHAAFKARVDDAKAKCDAITEPDELADAARDWLLATADYYELRHGRRDPGHVRMLRRRANAADYREAQALFWLAQRFKQAADERHGLTPAEQAQDDERRKAEAAGLRAAINAMLSRT